MDTHLVARPGQEQRAVQLFGAVQEGGARQHHAARRGFFVPHLLLQQVGCRSG